METPKHEGAAILFSEKEDFKRSKEGHYTLVKGIIHLEAITTININVLNNGVQTLGISISYCHK